MNPSNPRLRFLTALLIISILFTFSSYSTTLPLFTSVFRKPPDRVTFIAVGDIMMDRAVRDHMNKYGLDYPFQKIDRRFFQEADILLGNLEGPVVAKKTNFGHLTFGMSPDIIPTLKDFGFDMFALANNHGLDQGWSGHDSTKQLLSEASIGWFGHPAGELHEENILFSKVKGVRFAFIGLTDVYNKAGREQEAIKNIHAVLGAIRDKVDYIVVFPHWGPEYVKKPAARQVNFAHAFIDAGADIIIGHHPHVVQEKEFYNGKWIYYSLGNFIFDQYWSKETQKGLVIRVTFQGGKISVEEFPTISVKSQPSFIHPGPDQLMD